jgi:hypothetical protein
MGKYDTNKKIRKAIDSRLKKIASLQAHLGTDSTKKEKETTAKEQRKFWYQIKNYDKEFFNSTYKLDK